MSYSLIVRGFLNNTEIKYIKRSVSQLLYFPVRILILKINGNIMLSDEENNDV